MQTGSSGTLIGWKSGQTTFVPLWDRMEGAWLRTLVPIIHSLLVGFLSLTVTSTYEELYCTVQSEGLRGWHGRNIYKDTKT